MIPVPPDFTDRMQGSARLSGSAEIPPGSVILHVRGWAVRYAVRPHERGAWRRWAVATWGHPYRRAVVGRWPTYRVME